MKEFKIIQTKAGNPEHYDVFKNDEYVAFLHLNRGSFACGYKGDWVYVSKTKGYGVFDSEQEKVREINAALKNLKDVMEEEIEKPIYEVE